MSEGNTRMARRSPQAQSVGMNALHDPNWNLVLHRQPALDDLIALQSALLARASGWLRRRIGR